MSCKTCLALKTGSVLCRTSIRCNDWGLYRKVWIFRLLVPRRAHKMWQASILGFLLILRTRTCCSNSGNMMSVSDTQGRQEVGKKAGVGSRAPTNVRCERMRSWIPTGVAHRERFQAVNILLYCIGICQFRRLPWNQSCITCSFSVSVQFLRKTLRLASAGVPRWNQIVWLIMLHLDVWYSI